jgi:hypothetical protein
VVEDVPTLSARIEEKQKRIENRKGLRAYKLKNFGKIKRENKIKIKMELKTNVLFTVLM